MKMINNRRLVASACAIALVLVGCGDGGSRPTPTPNTAAYPAPTILPTEPPSGYPAAAETAAPPTSYPAP